MREDETAIPVEAIEAAHEDGLLERVWGDGYVAGLRDMQNGLERQNPYSPEERRP